jgi:hypothetical protein
VLIIWAIWNTRNSFIFNKTKKHSFLQVIPMATHWICMWSYLQQEEQRGDGFLVQPFGDGSSGYIQAVRLPVA